MAVPPLNPDDTTEPTTTTEDDPQVPIAFPMASVSWIDSAGTIQIRIYMMQPNAVQEYCYSSDSGISDFQPGYKFGGWQVDSLSAIVVNGYPRLYGKWSQRNDIAEWYYSQTTNQWQHDTTLTSTADIGSVTAIAFVNNGVMSLRVYCNNVGDQTATQWVWDDSSPGWQQTTISTPVASS